ncbi:MAG TPA: YfiR family protein [Bacteroidales bacterium]|nr:YfiR family protein [Bacteroidales bacterium]
MRITINKHITLKNNFSRSVYKRTGLIILLSVLTLQGFSQASIYVLKAVYLEKFSRFITWPEESLTDDTSKPFIISVIGKTPLTKNLEQIYAIQKIKNKRVIIQSVTNIKDIEGSHVLFIAESEKKNIDKIISITKHQPILTIGETKGYAEKGVLINFFEKDNKLRFEINETAVLKSPLQMSYYLLNSAKIVQPVEE